MNWLVVRFIEDTKCKHLSHNGHDEGILKLFVDFQSKKLENIPI